tara:strand:+ start:722 stop:919 length:198 start_codon:yes stop_codon:yes gene_type:complete
MNGNTWDSIHKVMTGLLTAALIGLATFVVEVKVELAQIHLQLEQANSQTTVILTVLDTIAPRTPQ